MKVRAFTYSRYHGKGDVGSTRLRVHQLMKYWPEYEEYVYGEHVDVMIYQKVYMQDDWKYMYHFNGLQILDICDPDWLENQNVKQTIDAVDGVVCPTEPMAEFLRQLTTKPIKVIPDRHDLEGLPKLRQHYGTLKRLVWFGYSHNAELLKEAIRALEKNNLELTVISNEDPFAQRWASEAWEDNYHYQKFDAETILDDLRGFDAFLNPQGNRPQDRFKSNNRTTLAWLAGLPVVATSQAIGQYWSPEARNTEAKKNYHIAKSEYDVKKSVQEMQDFIKELKH